MKFRGVKPPCPGPAVLPPGILPGGDVNKILLVDDDEIFRNVTTKVLSREGYSIDQAASLREAEERIRQEDYALLLTDMKMPDGDGVQTIREFKEIRPNLDVVVMTGYGTLDTVIESLRAGATDILFKPCSSQQLKDTIHKAIHKRELTEQNKQLRVLNEMKDKFLNLVSHEFRTPLTLIHGYLALFQKQGGTLSPQQLDTLGILVKATRKLITLVNNIEMLTQAIEGEMQLFLQPIEAVKLLSDVLAEMKSSVPERNLGMRLETGEPLEPFYGDSIRLRQACMELIQNSIRNTPDGGEIVAGARREGNRVALWIQDNGIGIPESEQGKIFEPFYEVADTELHTSSVSSFRGGGLGIGLAQVRAIVHAHQGSIHLESAPGKGTRIELSLPADLEPPHHDFMQPYLSGGRERPVSS